ncbi:MAG: hypothetical protein PWR10_2062 [Halanaerobiales bacterium]|nr:hypothetical protein [Halanaerobiales bacterium]
MEKDTQKIKIKVPRSEIVFIDQVFKSYEGLAMVTVDKREKGILYLDVTAGTKPDVLEILKDLKQKFPLNILES